ncbi:MAG TPA: cytochrome c biogenesis CcdA family protein [Acidimicrobiales bacterium]|nr:cytochrome c biogenesis CcdA family protein [Acidimicrobiales bacterium]|tara:strand:- start:759 stop:1859 length:1101 start_codon:yes stop_codon:yes gene_type:complete
MIDIKLALPFTLGLITAINPCGFAMLPTWLGYFLSKDSADQEPRPEQIWRAFLISLTMTSGFVLVFGGVGLAVSFLTTEESIAQVSPWLTVVFGGLFIPYGLAIFSGRQIKFSLPVSPRGPNTNELWSIFGFGVSYAIVSIGCAAPIFLLQIADSFSREGIFEGTITYFVFAFGMASVVTILTISLAAARSGVVQNLRRVLPYIDRLSGVLLLVGGCYLISYGIFEIRVLNNPTVSSNSFLDAVSRMQSHLSNWITSIGGVQLGLTLWLLVLTMVVWGVGPALNSKVKRITNGLVFACWIVGEGLIYKGEMLIFPLYRLLINWPSRISNWMAGPARWAIPLEIFFTLFVMILFFFSVIKSFKKLRR